MTARSCNLTGQQLPNIISSAFWAYLFLPLCVRPHAGTKVRFSRKPSGSSREELEEKKCGPFLVFLSPSQMDAEFGSEDGEPQVSTKVGKSLRRRSRQMD